jgi:superfamily I DNA/RNA helicase
MKTGRVNPDQRGIKVMMLQVKNWLEFPVVALGGIGRMPVEGEVEREQARLFHVGATRATQRLMIWASRGGKFEAWL